MAGRRLSVRKIKEVLRLKCDHQLSNRQIARSCCISHSTVIEYIQRARDAGLGWPLPPELDDCTLEELLFPPPGKIPKEERSMPSMDYIHRELRRKGVTLQLLWHEYKEADSNGYQYSQFCERYRRWKAKLDVSLRHEHKAVVEAAVLMVERAVLAPLRNRTFFSRTELNGAIWEKIEELNDRKFQKLDTTRRELFESLDKPALKPLPAQRYQYAQWKKARVNIDYHIEMDHHYYSVPYQLVKEQVDVRLTAATLEVFHKGRRVASHLRSYRAGKATTTHEHRPKSHQRYLEWTPSRIIRWAAKNGSHTGELVTRILESKPHPEQGFRSCLGVMRLGKRYTPERLEAACARALAIKAHSYKSVASILKSGLDGQPFPYIRDPTAKTINHPNIRGKDYYR